MVKLPPDWNDLISLLLCHRVRFLIVGAHAVAAAGRPRATQDLDIWVDPTAENAESIGRALADFGFPALAAECHRFAERDRMATLGVPPLRIDIMTSISGVVFESAWSRRAVARFGEHEVGFLGVADLLENKRASGRPKDLADIALMEEIGVTDTDDESDTE